jgi:hypothetical protein
VLIGGGLALVAVYNNAQGRIDLDVVSTKVSVATFKSEESILNQIATGFTVADSAANIEAGLPALAADASHINSITSNSGTVSAAALNFTSDEAALNKVAGGFDVSGTGANIAAIFDAMDADVAHVDSVALVGSASPVLTLTQAQATADAALLGKIAAPYVLNVTNGDATTITGDASNLTIDATTGGGDTITGGGANETFVFQATFGQDAISDFSAHDLGAGHDLISLPASDFSSFAAMTSPKAATSFNGNVVIATTDGDTLTLDNLSLSALNGLSADFKFHA